MLLPFLLWNSVVHREPIRASPLSVPFLSSPTHFINISHGYTLFLFLLLPILHSCTQPNSSSVECREQRGSLFLLVFFLFAIPLSRIIHTMSAYGGEDPRLHGIKTKIRVVPDFPKPGIMFQDITTLLLDPKAFKDTIDLFVERYKGKNISVVAGIEARGFIFGPPIALAIGAKFVPLRKPKKLPGKVISQDYILEYGRDCLEMHVGAVEPGERALVVDDLIATGGTLCAAMDLLERVGAEVEECACVIELPELKGRERLNGKPLHVLVECFECCE